MLSQTVLELKSFLKNFNELSFLLIFEILFNKLLQISEAIF